MDKDLKSVIDWVDEEYNDTIKRMDKAKENKNYEELKECMEKLKDLKEELDWVKIEIRNRKIERKQI